MGALLAILGAGMGALPGLPFLSTAVSFLRSPIGRGALIALGAVILLGGAYHKGAAKERRQCQADALRAELQATQLDLSLATNRARVQGDILQKLGAGDTADAETLNRYAAAIAAAKLQSTQPGAKRDANALLDDQCRLTKRGAGGRL